MYSPLSIDLLSPLSQFPFHLNNYTDVHCYICDNDPNFNYGDVTDPNLADHLLTFGVNIAQVQKTEKSLAELELERNQNFDFSTTTEDGKTMETMVGPGFTGLKNLGNTCVLANMKDWRFRNCFVIH